MPELEWCPLPFVVCWSSCRFPSESASNDVNDCEHDDPNRVHEVPVERQHMRALGVFLFDETAHREGHDNQHRQQTSNDVGRVQTDERIERRAKEVRLNRESFVVNQVLPLTTRSEEEIGSKRNGRQPPEAETLRVTAPQGAHGEC